MDYNPYLDDDDSYISLKNFINSFNDMEPILFIDIYFIYEYLCLYFKIYMLNLKKAQK